jgi:hypothetical protein
VVGHVCGCGQDKSTEAANGSDKTEQEAMRLSVASMQIYGSTDW